jgi:hypothetical protein
MRDVRKAGLKESDRGVELIEYALLASLVILGAIVAVGVLTAGS